MHQLKWEEKYEPEVWFKSDSSVEWEVIEGGKTPSGVVEASANGHKHGGGICTTSHMQCGKGTLNMRLAVRVAQYKV